VAFGIIFAIVRKAHGSTLGMFLSLLKLRSYVSGGFEAGGDWAVAFRSPSSRRHQASMR